MPKRSQLCAEIDPEVIRALKHQLVDDGLSYRKWLIQTIRGYAAAYIHRLSPQRPELYAKVGDGVR